MINILIFVAFLIRLIALDQSLWLDEGTTAKVIRNYSYIDVVKKFLPNDFHPPLYYWFMKFWAGIFGSSEIGLRIPSVIFSVLTGYVIYLIGRKLKDRNTGMWAAAFFLFNPLVIYYSQEARMYMMVTFLLTTALYFFVNMGAKTAPLRNIIFFGLFSSLAFLTFYGSVFLIAVFLIYFLVNRQYRTFIFSLLFFIFSLIVISPLLYQQMANARESLKIVANWTQVLGKANLKNLLLIPLKFFVGRVSFTPKIVYYAVAGSWSSFLLFLLARSRLAGKRLRVFVIGPLALGLIFSFFSPLFQYFRFLYLLPSICLLLALREDKGLIRGIVLSGFMLWSLLYLLLPQFHREDWKSLAKQIKPADNVYMISSSADALIYYIPGFKIYDLRLKNDDLKNKRELTIIPYTAEIYGIDYGENLKKNNFRLISEKNVRNLTYEYWMKN